MKNNTHLEALKRTVLKKALKNELKKKIEAQSHRSQQDPQQTRPPIVRIARDVPLPLSFAQQRLWFLHQLDPAAGLAYHIPVALRLIGRLNRDALSDALNHLVARHEILRTRFILLDGHPCQHIDAADLGFPLFCQDLRGLTPDEHNRRIGEFASLESETPFDLTQGPLIRGRLVQLTDDEHVLMITQHHIISDGWSVGVLVHELGAFYRAALEKEVASLPLLPVQYADYAVWQRDWLQGEHLTKQRDFWRSQLEDAPARLELPTDSPRPAKPSYTAGQVSVHFDASLLAALKSFGQRHHATLFMTLLTGWSIVLSRLSGQDDIVIGTPIANRPGQELEGLIGFFVNTLALRVTLKETKTLTVLELLAHVREQALAAYAHQDLPFEQVVEAVQPERSLSYSPIFQVMLALNNTPAKTLTLPGLQLAPAEQARHNTHFDLTLSLTETEAGLFGELEYAADLFDSATIERMAGYLRQVLLSMTADATQTIARLPLLPDAERQQLLVAFNATQADFDSANGLQNTLIHQLIEAQAELAPDAIAVVGSNQSLSYRELNQRANRLAHYLIAQGVRPDDRVAICVERNPDMIVALLAILKSGAAYVPLDPAYPADRLAYMLEDAAPVMILTQSTIESTLRESALAGRLPHTIPAVFIDNPPPLMETLPTDNSDAQTLGLTSNHLAYVIYTSGSTGKPKGVAIAHRNTVNLLLWAQQMFGREALANTLFATSLNFDLSVYECFAPLISGGTVHIVSDALSLIATASVTKPAVNLINTVPSAIAHLLDANAIPATVHTINLAGEALKPHLVEQLFARTHVQNIYNLYGPSETTTYSTGIRMDRTSGFVSHIGRPVANTQVYILDADGQPVPLGVTGEIYIAGHGVARGYLNRPELTAERFLPCPFSTDPNEKMYRTGDLARWLPDGNIEYLGRNDFQVKIRGFRIELGEIEARLMQCQGVREAVVIAAVENEHSGQKRLVAYLLAQEGAELRPATLRQQLAQHLADYMLPSAFMILDAFPLTPNGKLDRKALPAPDFSAVIARGYAAPMGEAETALAQIWQDLLGLEQVGRHDHFFELGGHSLLIVSLIERLHPLGWRLDVRSVFATPVLSDLARSLSTGQVHQQDLASGLAADQADRDAFVVPPNLIPEKSQVITPDMLPLVTLSQAEIDAIAETVSGGVSNIQDIYPLTPLQEGILFHHLLQTQGDDYLLQSLLVFDSRERLDGFLAALQLIIDRHDILRTSIYWQDLAQPVQVVWRQALLGIHHLMPESGKDALAQLRAHTDPHKNRLDLNRAPLFIADIVFADIVFTDIAAGDIASAGRQNEWLLSLRFHHLVSDHLTLELIFAEIAQVLAGNAASLPAPLPYRNFIAQNLNVPVSVHEDYFRAQLADITEPTAPFGILKVPDDNRQIVESRLLLEPALAQEIRLQARRFGVSPSVLFHVACAQVLAQTSLGNDIVFGSVLLGRLQGISGINRILGMFINTLPIRLSLQGDSVQEVVQAAYQNLTALLEHEQAPLSLAQRCSGVAQPMPLFSTLLNYRHSQLNEKATTEEATTGTSWAGIRILAAEEQTNYPVTLTVDDLGTHFHLMAQTVPEIDPDRMVNYLLTAIRGLVAALRHNPQQPIQPISVIPLAEQQQLLVDFNATQTAFPAPTHVLTPTNVLIHSLFEAEAARHPDAIAVVYGEQSLSYAELNRRANHLAHHLMVLGVQPDERVAICVERGPEMVAGLLAILKAGGAYVPLDPAYPAERLAYMLKDSAPVVLLTQSKIQQAIHFDWLSDTMPIIVLDDQAESERPERESNPVRSDLTAQHLAYVVYTSGSTGVPKGVMSSHQALANRLLWFVHSIATPPLVVAQKTSISFVDSVTETLGTLLAGGKLVVFSNDEVKDPARFCAGLQYHHVNLLVVVPSLLKLLVSQAPISQNRQDHALSSIRTLICSGERLTPELARQVSENYPSLRLLNFYGSSEINGDAIWHEYDAALGVPEASVIGRPIANSRCYILDAHQQLVPLGVAGEIYIAGRGLARGYLNRPELTAERFFADPFSDAPNEKMYRTGDLGRWLSDGTIEYLGRNDFQVKIRGFRIEPGEIEAQLLRCHGVKEAAVVAREDRPNQQQLVAYLRAQDGVELIPAELRQRLSLHLADYMLPTAFVVLETFPLTPNGKLDRKALPIPDAQAIVSRDYAAPLGETETILAQIWQDLLGLARVGRHDHFFELGGHSLLAIQLVARIRQALERELPLQTIFAQPVLMRLAHTLDQTGATKQSTTPKTIPKADRSQPLPLSFAQQRLWFLGQLDPAASLAYHLSAALRLTGSLNHHALTTALDNLVARHESLRTRFVTDVGQENAEQVYQHIDPADGGFSLLYRDLRQLIPSPHTQHVSDIIDLEARTPFDFAHDPLMRGQLLQLSDDEHVLLLTLHHIITDGWSLGVLVRELGAFYRAALNGHAASLPHLPVQYADYAVWQRAQQQEAALSAQRDFWRSQLAGIPALLTLPTDRPRPTVQSYRGGQVPFQLDATLLASLKRLGQRHNTTLFMTVLSAWSLVLARLSGQDDIVIGTPVANRPHQELEGLIGFFANTLALRIRLAKEMSVADLLAQTRGQALSAYAHQDLPFEQVVEALQPERSLSYSPIFQVMLTLNNTPAQSLELPGLQLASMEQSSIGQARHGAYFDLTLSLTEMPLTETESGLVGVLSYAADLFDFATVERMSGYLKNILTAMAADETQAVATLPMLTTAEKQQVLVHFNATQTDFLPANRLVHQMVEMQAAQQPDAIAVLFFDQTIGDQTIGDQIADHQTGDHQTLSYGELNRRANRLAHYLIALGVRPDERVAICVERSPEMVVGLLAILKAGGAYVPLDPAYPAERLAYMLQDAAPVVLLTQASLVQTLPSAEQTITLLLDSKPDYLAEQPAHNPDIAVLTPHHLAYVIYTSGSTGLPKGVEMPLGVLSNLLQWHRNAPQPAGTGKTLQFAALGFDVAFQEIFTTLGEGGSLVLIPETLRREPQQLLRLIQQQQIERIFLPYIALQHLAETADHHPGDLSCLAHVITAGEQLRITPAIQRFIRRAGCRLHNHYGPTESHVITSYTLSKAIEQWPTLPPIGRPIANARVYILDEYRQPVPLGVTGEIYLAGHGVAGYGLADQGLARGYLNRPELTAERFLNDPFSGDPNGKMYRTGDLGRWLPDGNIDYLGRNDFQVKLRGFRIELGEIEAQLMLCQGVREAVVIAREDEPDHKRLVAYVCLQEQCLQENRSQTDVGLNPAALRQQLSEHLAEYMLPSAFVMLDAFPLTPNGKLDRKALPAPDATAMVLRSYAAPVGETETALAHIWQDLLKLEQVGRHDHFFELGGHSLLAVQLVARVRQALGRGLQLQQLFAQPVLMDLARSMTEAAHEPQAAMTAITVADRSQPLPLSFAQQRLWFLAQLDPAASLAYHLSAALRLNGRLSQHALTVALNHLIARHEGLRTRFVAAGENVCQYIDPADNGFSLQYRDLRSLSPTQHTQQVIELIDLDARTPFDLSLGPLIRGQLLQLTDDEYVLLLTLHHIITDGWSLGVLVRELGAFYRAALYNAVHSLPPLSIQYADYAVWQRDQRQATALTEQRDFWCGQLKDAPALLTLPLDRPRPAVQSYAGSQVTFRLDAKTLASLKALGKRYNCTLFMALLTGWSIVLARLSGQDDIVIGTPVANRPQPELEELIGFFVNTLALRVRFSEGLSVAELLAQVRENALAAYAHQDLPFEQVVEALQPERSLSYSPVFQAMLALNNTPAQELNLPELRLTPFEQATHTTHFDLTLSLVETDSGLAGALSYATDLFDNATAERMVGYFVNVLTAMAADETQSIAHLPILPKAERQQLLVEFNDTPTPRPLINNPENSTIHRLFEIQAAQRPDAIALAFEGQKISYGELNQRANRLAHYLIALGVRPDDRVAICLERSADMIIGLLAILKAGGAYVPLDPAYPAERLRFMLDDASPMVLLTQTAQLSKLPNIVSPEDISTEVAPADSVPVFLFDKPGSALEAQPDHNPHRSDLTSRHLAYVIYTSGSTGQPKGVMVEHHSVNRLVINNTYAGIGADDCVAHCANVAFDASTWEIWSALLNGGRLYIVNPSVLFDPQRLCDSLIAGKVTALWLTAGLFNEYIDGLKPVFGQLRYLLVGGDVLDPLKIQHVLSAESAPARLINGYGPTETTTFAATYGITAPVDMARSIPIGRPIANTRIYILDRHGEPVPAGVTGELYIGGSGVARGYLNNPALTAERFMPDPFCDEPDAKMYKTGDLGRWLADGTIEYLGRNDFQVKLRGFRIELSEIETRLVQCHGVREAVVIAREETDSTQQKRLVAYLLPQPGIKLSPAELRQQLARHLAEYMLPSAFVTLTAFPLTPNGKLDRQALPAPDSSAIAARSYAAPVGKTETQLAQIWQALLGLPQIGRYDHFFELGGHSLLAVQLLNRMREQGMEMPLTALFAHPTLCDLACAIGERLAMSSISSAPVSLPLSPFEANPVPLSPAGSLPPLFLVHEASGDPLVYLPLAALLPPELPVYALQALGIHTIAQPPESIEALAACHIQAIRRLQPQGPYRLAGWSIGGLIAYEIARQLINSGDAVTFLGMIDSYHHVSDTSPGADQPAQPAKANNLAQQIELIIDALRIQDQQSLEALRKFDSLEQALDHCIARQWLPADITRQDILLRTYTAERVTQLGQRYVPEMSAIPVHFYNADELSNGALNDKNDWHGWRDIAGDNSELHMIGGTHFSIMQPPLLNQIADSITEQVQAVPIFDPRVIIQSGTKNHAPLFCLPGAGASPSSLLELALSFPPHLPIYALQARGFTEEHHFPYTSVEGAARAYIRTIRDIQPHGPYHLLGHSFGGWIAFEIALQLQAAGEQVANLIIIDSDAPDQPDSDRPSVNRTETIMELIDIYDMILNQPLPLTRQDIETRTPDEQTQLLHNTLVQAGLFAAKTPTSLLQGIIRVMQANLNTRYIPRTGYAGKVHLISAEEGSADEKETRESQWSTHVTQLDVMLVPGNHMTMLSMPSTGSWVNTLWQLYIDTNVD